jgi:alkanesulfonate monooxygenase SsuD/methylene tetrahydromethanopterin reductase-like flavin-dependent oxidoreductase (luciferase family)
MADHAPGKRPVHAALRINMTGLQEDPREEAERYRAAIEMAVYAEAHGFDTVNLEEHHCAENGWLPSPLVLAAMIVARTQRVRVSVTALLATLYDPIRLAEDVAVLDLVSGGRFTFTAGLGYRPVEYHATGKSWADRGRLMDELIETLLTAWKGEPFEYRGETIRVTPTPLTKPHPLFLVGGMSRAAARRAARFGLPFYPPQHEPELQAFYEAELQRQGQRGFYLHPGEGNSMLVVEDDPERAWQELAPCFLRELKEYGSWKVEGVPRPSEEDVSSVEDLRAQKRFEILTPAAAREALVSGQRPTAVLHPLAGGVPLERAWRQLETFATDVLAPVRAG